MQVTDELIKKAAREMCIEGGFDPDEPMPNDGPRWRYYMDGARAALTAALSDQERAVEVKALTWVEGWGGSLDDIPEWRAKTPWGSLSASVAGCRDAGGNRFESHRDVPSDLKERLITEATAHYEAKIRSALVDVPVEPVAKRWLVEETLPSGVIKWEVVEHENHARKIAAMYRNATVTPLYTSPPLSREGEDSAEVERLTRPIVGIEHRTAQEVFDIMADRIRLAATRSGSATSSNGGEHG